MFQPILQLSLIDKSGFCILQLESNYKYTNLRKSSERQRRKEGARKKRGEREDQDDLRTTTEKEGAPRGETHQVAWPPRYLLLLRCGIVKECLANSFSLSLPLHFYSDPPTPILNQDVSARKIHPKMTRALVLLYVPHNGFGDNGSIISWFPPLIVLTFYNCLVCGSFHLYRFNFRSTGPRNRYLEHTVLNV